MEHLIGPAFNFFVFVGLLAYLLPKPVKAFVAGRHDFIREEVLRVQEKLRASRARFEEFSSKLKAVDAEIAGLRSQAQQDAQAASTRVVTEAKRLSSQIVSDAETTAKSLFGDLRTQLRQEVVSRVILRTEAILRHRLTGDDRVRIRKEFSRQLGGIQ
jgi:F-type H+-transporting ATPase subunit b